MKAQRTCLSRAKIIMALSYAALRGPSVFANVKHQASLRSTSAPMPTKCVAPHMLENSECCSHTHKMLLTRNTRFTQQTLMQPLYVTLFIMLRGYLDEFQIAGAKTATQQIRNRLGAPTRNVSSSVGVARLRRTREKNALYYIEQRPLTVEADT